ncbi:MAG: hypothetical protein FK733_13870 [Asgard group archaeon]|nr:hypothetical protein [Asgard group archaeon]
MTKLNTYLLFYNLSETKTWRVSEIIIKNKKLRKKTAVFSILIYVALLTTLFSITNSNSYPVTIYSEGDYAYMIIEDLIGGNKYDIELTYSTSFYDIDAGFSVHDKNNYRASNLILTQDDNGTGFEYATLNATRDGNYYVKIWINDVHGLDETGSLDLDVFEQGTGFEMDISTDYSIWRSLRWVWIMLGVVGGISILAMVVIFTVIIRAAKKYQVKVADAREKDMLYQDAVERKTSVHSVV